LLFPNFFLHLFSNDFFRFFWFFSKTFSIKVLFFVVGLPVFKLTFFFQMLWKDFFVYILLFTIVFSL